MYSAYNEGKHVVVERFIRTLRNKILKYLTSISRNAYIVKSANIFNEYNNMQQNLISKGQQALIHHNLLKRLLNSLIRCWWFR